MRRFHILKLSAVTVLLLVIFMLKENYYAFTRPPRFTPAIRYLENGTKMDTVSSNATVFIMGYHRTGSTFTASVLASYPGAFYVYEPWFYILDNYVRGSSEYATFANGTSKRVTDAFIEQLRQEELHAWATCDLKRLPLGQFRSPAHAKQKDSLAGFYLCVRIRQSSSTCIDQLEKTCRLATIRVIKFIRLRMFHIGGLVTLYPHIKYIHLLRDPRGTAVSQSRLKTYKGNSTLVTKDYCEVERANIAVKEKLFASSPERMYTLQYEHLAENPLLYASKMLIFVDKNLQLTSTMEAYIRYIALSGNGSWCNYCVDRGNGSKMASKWRLEISWTLVKIINTICGDILDYMGHKRFENKKELRNMSIPYTVNP